MQSLRKALTGGDKSNEAARFDIVAESGTFSQKVACVLDDFKLCATLGTGTFGRVRLVEFERHDAVAHSSRFYAMKILKKSEILRLKQVEHIHNEISLQCAVEHPFIVNMANHFMDAQRVFMVLEFVPGGELFTYLRNEGRLHNDEARFFASQIVMAFGYLHSKHIAYRDLKPENLLITRTGYLKMADFGFAKVVEQRTWTLCGTPEYLAPEIIKSKGHGCPVDWWAFGVLVYEMVAGYPPFYDENSFGIYQKILAGTVEYPKHMDGKAVSLLKKLLAADRSKRIGCLRGGVADVQKCKWLQKVNWKAVFEGSEQAQYVPTLVSEGDTGNFDDYPESEPDRAAFISNEDAARFEEFDHIGHAATKEDHDAHADADHIEAKCAE